MLMPNSNALILFHLLRNDCAGGTDAASRIFEIASDHRLEPRYYYSEIPEEIAAAVCR
jgi:hypothetical protein